MRLWFLLIFGFGQPVAAQDAPELDNVESRPRPDFEALGVRNDSFTLFPRLLTSLKYDDNIFADENNRRNDLITEVTAEIDATRQWLDNELDLSASAIFGRYDDFSSEDYDDWRLGLETRLRPTGDSRLSFGLETGRFHIDRSSVSDASGLTPVEYDESKIDTRYTRQQGRYSLALDARGTRGDYDDVSALRAGNEIELNQDDRDNTRYLIGFRGAYSMLPVSSSEPHEIFFQLKFNRREFDNLTDFSNLDRSSRGYETAFGLTLNIDHIFIGDLYVGYRSQNYRDSFPDISAPELGAKLDWHLSRVTTLKIRLGQTIEDTVNTDFAGYISTQLQLGLVRELRRHMTLSATLLWADNEFDGIGPAERDDTLYVAALSLDYSSSRNLSFSAGYNLIDNDSNDNTIAADDTQTFSKNIVFVSMNLQI